MQFSTYHFHLYFFSMFKNSMCKIKCIKFNIFNGPKFNQWRHGSTWTTSCLSSPAPPGPPPPPPDFIHWGGWGGYSSGLSSLCVQCASLPRGFAVTLLYGKINSEKHLERSEHSYLPPMQTGIQKVNTPSSVSGAPSPWLPFSIVAGVICRSCRCEQFHFSSPSRWCGVWKPQWDIYQTVHCTFVA